MNHTAGTCKIVTTCHITDSMNSVLVTFHHAWAGVCNCMHGVQSSVLMIRLATLAILSCSYDPLKDVG